MELKSVKTQSDIKLTQFEHRLNQIENRFAHLEGRQNGPASRKGYDNDYSYEDSNSDYYHNY
jgi:hypothetical protein